ncbi:hypothetical protein GWC95_01135 [Sediminibacterium roseum]|uniref:Outer membrane protein beta-barrel domain-containing protein n=1 Tax=Sediminibacterium roseum TaxID=1978412 RepID=A0ABW9ZN62_9BACT|nr:hypothetical protein [Sediminibacterium roseum]NCI48506.1 hypothetical protein [Sediminibacterium roseum]
MRNFRTTILLILIAPLLVHAQEKKKERKGEFYFSWGYNKEWYTRSDVKVSQPSLNNNYKLKSVRSHDHPGWDEGLFSIPISIPQYNYRLGFFFNKKKGLAFEINFDHTKHIIQDGQSVRLSGVLNGRQTDSTIGFSEANGFYYYLNNGANFLLFNIVKRWNWQESKTGNFKIDALGKAGIGPVIPHVQNSFFGKANDPGFQLGGWNIGVEGAVRATFYKTVFLEFSNKLDYARYSNLKIYEGTAKQAFGTYELILSLGITL